MKSKRIDALDIGRGFAMALVLISHAGWMYYETGLPLPQFYHWMKFSFQFATPTFLFISGSLISYLYYTHNKEEWKRTKFKLLKRGLLLVTFTHIAITGARVIQTGEWLWFFKMMVITDIIGLTLLAYLFLFERFRIRLYQAFLILGISYVTLMFYRPEFPVLVFFKQFLAGSFLDEPQYLYTVFAFLPMAAMYHCGVVLGEKMVKAMRSKQLPRFIRQLYWIGGITILFMLVVKFGGEFLLNSLSVENYSWYILVSITNKYPPSIPFMAYSAGFSLILLASLILYGQYYSSYGAWGSAFKILGQTSLFTFVIQAHIYSWIRELLGIVGMLSIWSWTSYALSSTALIWVLSYLYLRFRIKRNLSFKGSWIPFLDPKINPELRSKKTVKSAPQLKY